MNMDAEQKMLLEYAILREMIQDSKTGLNRVGLGPLQKEIKAVWEKLKDNAPPDFGSLYAEFQAEYEKLKDFILYEPLIGKNIVALGGGFSCGKSSFLNAMMARASGNDYPILPENIDPTTSVPTYLVHGGDTPRLLGINIFDCQFEMPAAAIRLISHGFGVTEEGGEGVTLGHIVRNFFLAIDAQPYEHIAFLDTPGYSAPSESNYSAKTDEQIARQQLNTATQILWFVQCDAGTITERDVEFLQTLRQDIPKLVILSKVDKKPREEVETIRRQIADVLRFKNISVEGILTFSNSAPDRCQMEELEQWLDQINHPNQENQFAINFKKLFLKTRDFYCTREDEERRQLEVLNRVLTLEQDRSTSTLLEGLIQEIKEGIRDIQERRNSLKSLQTTFFRELKTVGSQIGLDMPEPSEIELLGERRQDLLAVLDRCLSQKHITPNTRLCAILENELSGAEVVINQEAGGLAYRERLTELLSGLLTPAAGRVRINDVVEREGTSL